MDAIKKSYEDVLFQHVILDKVIYDCDLTNFQVAPTQGDTNKELQFFVNGTEIFVRVKSKGLQRVAKVEDGKDRNICVKDDKKATVHKIKAVLGTLEDFTKNIDKNIKTIYDRWAELKEHYPRLFDGLFKHLPAVD